MEILIEDVRQAKALLNDINAKLDYLIESRRFNAMNSDFDYPR